MRIAALLIIGSSFLVASCSHEPTPVAPVVKDFEVSRYLGTWYEVLRMPHSFEEGLDGVTAEYRLNGDGTLEVTNRGYHRDDEEWQTAIGTAVPLDRGDASLKVTFFWPFYGGYYISELDRNYQYAIVTSDNHEYFWLLARDPDISQDVIDLAIAQANKWGFDTSQMIQVKHPAGPNL